MTRFRPTPSILALALLAFAVFQSFVAWNIQTRAADDLAEARRLSETEVESSDSEPESLGDYRAILASLEESIEIRRDIDDLLTDVEAIVGELGAQQAAARTTAVDARDELDTIAGTLGGAVRAARRSFAELTDLGDTLARSARLAARIAEELEELDRSMGPSLP